MANIDGTIRSVSNMGKDWAGAAVSTTVRANHEAWLVTADWAAYTGSADVARLLAVGAAIKAAARDGVARTIVGALPFLAGSDNDNDAVYFTGTAVQALTVSTDDLTGHLAVQAGTEITDTTGTTKGIGTIVIVRKT